MNYPYFQNYLANFLLSDAPLMEVEGAVGTAPRKYKISKKILASVHSLRLYSDVLRLAIKRVLELILTLGQQPAR